MLFNNNLYTLERLMSERAQVNDISAQEANLILFELPGNKIIKHLNK